MAYEVLSDPKKKEIYDEGGEQAIKEGAGRGGGNFTSPMDMFNMFFGGGGGFPGGGPHGGRSSNKSKPIVHKLGVTLEELYNGKTRKLAVTREICCEKCNGKGGSKVEKCQSCRGSGMKVTTKQIGPGMIQQMQSPCDACGSQGEVISEAHKCGSCKGEGVQDRASSGLQAGANPGGNTSLQERSSRGVSGQGPPAQDRMPGCDQERVRG